MVDATDLKKIEPWQRNLSCERSQIQGNLSLATDTAILSQALIKEKEHFYLLP
ncbi:hypothetical protein [Hydrococcus rivularis]|uniref:hypothetical protein n=1 Tax=Hydrococcus rivularis TaxID=1616834 RepID=UPI000ACC1D1E|nr:hypothetical protein [Hydrococcus rivularis]